MARRPQWRIDERARIRSGPTPAAHMVSVLLAIAVIVLVGGTLAATALRRPGNALPLRARAMRHSHFFAEGEQRRVSQELLLRRIEQYVREERAAVENFPENPSPADLRGRPPEAR